MMRLHGSLSEDAALYFTHQNDAEFWNVWTWPAERNGFGINGKSAGGKSGIRSRAEVGSQRNDLL